VDKEGAAGTIKGQGPCLPDKTDGAGLIQQQGLFYLHIIHRGSTINAVYIVMVLGIFMKHMKKNRPILLEQGWFFHWDNGNLHSSTVVQDWLTTHSVQVLGHSPYLLDLVLADFLVLEHEG
jgi:hypothetical protein